MSGAAEVELVSYLSDMDRTLSRTVIANAILTTTSTKKRKALLEGDDLARQNERNRVLVAEFINWRRCSPPSQAGDLLESLLTLAALTGLNLFPDGIFRKWEYVGSHGISFSASEQVRPADIVDALIDLSCELFRKLGSADQFNDAIGIIADTEWEISVGPLHPFYDACGRISRYYTTLLSLWFSLPVVHRGDRVVYFSHAVQGRQAFRDFFLACPRCTMIF
jgi:hypothetical protein